MVETFNCTICGTKMELIIEEISDINNAYYCYNCGTVLIAETRLIWKDEAVCGSVEEEKKWVIRHKHKYHRNNT